MIAIAVLVAAVDAVAVAVAVAAAMAVVMAVVEMPPLVLFVVKVPATPMVAEAAVFVQGQTVVPAVEGSELALGPPTNELEMTLWGRTADCGVWTPNWLW